MQKTIFSVCAVLVFVAGALFMYSMPFVVVYEDVALAFAPSAARASSYGDRHFNAIFPALYDIARAEKLYRTAENIDPGYPALQHQLARIAFLRADFDEALVRINREVETHGAENTNAYYIRALVLGYMGRYLDAAADYETYFTLVPANWAGINDYAWVLLKADLPEGALAALEWGLSEWPGNPWLLHNKVIALYELGRYEEAAAAAAAAAAAVETVTEADWLNAYPGNDPRSAAEGLSSFKAAVAANREKVEMALQGE